MSFSLSGKVALIAGASRGIGEATAKRLAAHGASVVCTSRKLDECERVASEIRATGGAARAMKLHLGERADHESVLASIEAEEKRLDILVNNGGTNPYFGPAAETPEGAWDKTLEVNLKGPFFLTARAIPLIKASGGGAIVNVASINGLKPGWGQGVYSITKAALISMTQVFAQEHGADGVRVNALCPGLTETRLAAGLIHDRPRPAPGHDGAQLLHPAHRPARGDGRRDPLSGVRRGRLHDRPDPGRGRRRRVAGPDLRRERRGR
jgi:NAD(P)-dependent dehydrogenase (short-subunit alcohol dehydrogenase family)